MQEQTFGTLVKVCLAFSGAVFSLMFLLFLVTGIKARFNFGGVFGMAASLLLAYASFGHRQVKAFITGVAANPAGKAVICALAVLAAAGIIAAAVISALMASRFTRLPDRPANVIILGCRVKENGPSLMLDKRISAAYAYLAENPETVCIASGGKGSDEPVSEAQCIKDGLTARGISPDRIILESSSTNTSENIRNSLELMDSLGLERRAVIVTSEFHQLRASMICGKAGLESYSLSSRTYLPLLPSYWIREWFAVIKQAVTG